MRDLAKGIWDHWLLPSGPHIAFFHTQRHGRMPADGSRAEYKQSHRGPSRRLFRNTPSLLAGLVSVRADRPTGSSTSGFHIASKEWALLVSMQAEQGAAAAASISDFCQGDRGRWLDPRKWPGTHGTSSNLRLEGGLAFAAAKPAISPLALLAPRAGSGSSSRPRHGRSGEAIDRSGEPVIRCVSHGAEGLYGRLFISGSSRTLHDPWRSGAPPRRWREPRLVNLNVQSGMSSRHQSGASADTL